MIELRLTDRRTLLRHLGHLGDPDPARRAAAALAAAEMVQRRGVAWDALIPLPSADPGDDVWPAPALRLLEQFGLTEVERDSLKKLATWRRPGREGLARVAEIAKRLGVE